MDKPNLSRTPQRICRARPTALDELAAQHVLTVESEVVPLDRADVLVFVIRNPMLIEHHAHH